MVENQNGSYQNRKLEPLKSEEMAKIVVAKVLSQILFPIPPKQNPAPLQGFKIVNCCYHNLSD
jgi:hypothetical protein